MPYLSLALAIQIDYAKVHDGAQTRHTIDDFHIAVFPHALNRMRVQLNQLTITKAATYEDNATVQIRDCGCLGRCPQSFQLKCFNSAFAKGRNTRSKPF